MDNENIFGEPVYCYTRKQAIADGVLADLSDNKIVRAHWRYPLACTSAVWGAIENAIRDAGGDLDGILHDISVLAKAGICTGRNKNQMRFTTTIGKAARELKLHIGPGDSREPVLTLMFADED